MSRRDKLGEVQRSALEGLIRHHSWQHGCGWVWDTPSGTRRILDALVRKGFARVENQGDAWARYWPTDAGRAAVKE